MQVIFGFEQNESSNAGKLIIAQIYQLVVQMCGKRYLTLRRMILQNKISITEILHYPGNTQTVAMPCLYFIAFV